MARVITESPRITKKNCPHRAAGSPITSSTLWHSDPASLKPRLVRRKRLVKKKLGWSDYKGNNEFHLAGPLYRLTASQTEQPCFVAAYIYIAKSPSSEPQEPQKRRDCRDSQTNIHCLAFDTAVGVRCSIFVRSGLLTVHFTVWQKTRLNVCIVPWMWTKEGCLILCLGLRMYKVFRRLEIWEELGSFPACLGKIKIDISIASQ